MLGPSCQSTARIELKRDLGAFMKSSVLVLVHEQEVTGLIAHSDPIVIQTDGRAGRKQGSRALDVLMRLKILDR